MSPERLRAAGNDALTEALQRRARHTGMVAALVLATVAVLRGSRRATSTADAL